MGGGASGGDGTLAYMDTRLLALRDFRDDCYACLYRRGDALFELTAGVVPSPVHLSGEAALVHGRLDETRLRALLAGHPLAEGQPVYAVDRAAGY